MKLYKFFIKLSLFFCLIEIHSQEYSFFEGKEEKKLYLQKDYLVDFSNNESFHNINAIDKNAKLHKQIGSVKIYEITDNDIKKKIEKGISHTINLKTHSKISEVFSFHPKGGPKVALPGNVIVKFKDSISDQEIQKILKSKGLKVIQIQKILDKDYYIIEFLPGLPSLELANQLRNLPEVEYSKPDLWIEISKR